MLYARVTSPYLSDSDHSDYLVDQLQDIGDVCSTVIPNITVRSVETYYTAPAPTSIDFGSTTTTSSAPAASTTCAGQIITGTSACNALSRQYGLPTGDLQVLSPNGDCTFTGSKCAALPCSIIKVPIGSTW